MTEPIPWDAIGAIGEIIGATAVFVTLVYLSIQIRHSIQATKALVRESVSDRIVSDIRAAMENETLAMAYIKLEKQEQLTELEDFSFERHIRAWIRTHENMYYQYRQGFLEKEEWQGHRRVMMAVFDPGAEFEESKRIQKAYDMWPDAYSIEFQDLIKRIRQQMIEIVDA